MLINKDITIEELVSILPQSVQYLMKEGIKCIACGEPIWGTLEEAAYEKKFGVEDVNRFVKELNLLLDNPKTENSIRQIKIDRATNL